MFVSLAVASSPLLKNIKCWLMPKESFASGAWIQIVRAVTPKLHSQHFRTVSILFARLVSFCLVFPVSISAFIPAFKGSCPTVPHVYLIPAWTISVHWRWSPFCSPLTISGRGETLEKGRDASPERMMQLVHIFALLYAVVVLQLGNGPKVGLWLSVCWERCEDDG